jgi:hypothetical protein
VGCRLVRHTALRRRRPASKHGGGSSQSSRNSNRRDLATLPEVRARLRSSVLLTHIYSHISLLNGYQSRPITLDQIPCACDPVGAVFGVPLRDSLRYASVQISTANQNGSAYSTMDTAFDRIVSSEPLQGALRLGLHPSRRREMVSHLISF